MLIRANRAASARATGRLALASLAPAAVVALTVATLLLTRRTPDAAEEVVGLGAGVTGGLTGLALAVAGAVLLHRSARSLIGWALTGFGVFWAADELAGAWTAWAISQEPVAPGASATLWIYARAGAALLLAIPLVLATYPSGRLPEPGRHRRWALTGLALTGWLTLALLVTPARVAYGREGEVPAEFATLTLDPFSLPLSDGVATVMLALGLPLTAVGAVLCTAALVGRTRGATGVERQRVRWLLWAGLVDALLLALAAVVRGPVVDYGMLLAVTVTSAAVVIGIVRPTLGDVDQLLGGTFVYGLLAVLVVGIDLVVVTLAGGLIGGRVTERTTLLLVLGVAAAVYLPARHLLWRLARRLLLGTRDDRYGVVSALATRLETAEDPAAQLAGVAAAVAEAFKVGWVGVEVDRPGGERLRVEHGRAPDETAALPISYRGEEVGRLLLPRHGLRAQLTKRDERLLGDVVRQAAAATRTSQLAAELQASREALVTSREEERRRLRRDLHDGLGPVLGAVVLRIDTARNQARTDPEAADATLRQARADVAAALDDVRRLVHDLRPPALDDVGVVRALEQQAQRLAPPGLRIEIRCDDLGELPAAVEVAVYRIASEAMTNAVRHAQASTCAVRGRREEGRVVLEIEDDGAGIDPGRVSGVGLQSVRERAAELGGRCEIVCPPGGGTLVRATLPLGPSA